MALTQKEISQLYVALLNRAADAGGVEFWQDQASLAEAAQAMIDSQAGTSFYPEDNRAFVEQIYENTVGLEGQEDADIQYWVDLLASGEYSRGELVAHMVNSIMDPAHEGTAFQESYLNRVAVSEYVARLELDGELSVEELVAATTFNEAGLGVVRTEADTTSAKEKAGELEAVDNTSLTEALAKLAAAKEAEADFKKGLELDVNNDGKYDSTDHAEGKATEANVNTVFGNAATAIGGATSTTLNAANYQDLTKQALQDTDMATAKTAAQGDVNVKAAAAKAGMTALIEAADQAKVEYNEAQEALTAANTAMTVETATFQAANSGHATANSVANVVYASAYTGAAGQDGKIIISNGKAYIGETGKALSELAEDKTVLRVAELEAANNGVVTATANVAGQLSALKEAVGAIYVAEAGGHSLKDIGADGNAVNSTTGAYQLDQSDVVVYKTAADAAKDVVQQVVTFGAITASDSTAATITIDGVAVDILATADANAVAAAIVAKAADFTNWTVTASTPADDKVIFTAKTPSVKELEAADIVFAASGADVDGGETEATLAAPGVAAGTEINIGDTVTPAAGAPNADALKTALGNLETLEKAIATFEEARDIKVELEALKKAAVDAGKAITDSVEDGGLGVSLREGDQNFTTSDDVYLFDATKTTATNLINFGAKGDDKIFFGNSFTGGLKEITKVANDNGDASALEIFWLQNGTSVDLYVEQKAFAGNGSTDSDLVKITLTGVDGDDLSFADGFLTIA